MANTKAGNVLIVDTDAQFDTQLNIIGIRYIAGTTPSVTIQADSSSGVVVYENANTASIFEQVRILLRTGCYVNVTGTGTKVYLYLE